MIIMASKARSTSNARCSLRTWRMHCLPSVKEGTRPQRQRRRSHCLAILAAGIRSPARAQDAHPRSANTALKQRNLQDTIELGAARP